MKKLFSFILIFAFFITSPASAEDEYDGDIGQPENVESVTVLVSSSLTTAISTIAREYSRKYDVDLNAVFESPSELVEKIKFGDPADIIIVSDPKWLDALQTQGLIDSSSKVKIAENHLSLVVSKDFKFKSDTKKLEDALDYIHSKALMVMSDPEVGALGERTQEVFTNIGRWGKFKKFTMLAPTSSKTVDLIIKSQTGGIIYSTDARLFNSQLHYIGDIPRKLHKPIEYYAAIVLGSNMDEARKFLTYLTGNDAKTELKKLGFIVK